MNAALADAFAQLVRARGPQAEAVALAMASLPGDRAPGATALEFLPVCGVLALAACAVGDVQGREPRLAVLHARADDLRFRVRDAVVLGLARIGGAAGDALVTDVKAWMDGYFHAAAVLRALASDPWVVTLHDAPNVVARFDDAFALLGEAPRAAARWPGHKALVEAVSDSLPAVAVRLGVPVFDMLTRWTAAKDPVLRDLVARAVAAQKLVGRFSAEVERVHRALESSAPAPRNPDHDVGPTRNRSKSRRKR